MAVSPKYPKTTLPNPLTAPMPPCLIVRITGQHHPGPDCQAGDSFSLIFQFQGGLLPGLYFVGGGIWAEANPGTFLHRVVDCCALRITAEAAPSSFGMCNLRAGPPLLEVVR